MSLIPSSVQGAPSDNYFVLKSSVEVSGPAIVGTGAPQAVAVPSISAASVVRISFVAGTPAGAAPVITITPGVGFSLTIPLASVYNYAVINP